jgi:hypothetical protein
MRFLLTIVLILTAVLLQAQPENPGPPAPVDGGLLLLAAAGAAYGYKKTKERFKG